MADLDDCLMVKVVEARNIMNTPMGPPAAVATVQVGKIALHN